MTRTEIKPLLRSVGVVALGNWASRLTGFARTVVVASALGFGLVGDAYNTANALPTILYQLLLGGAVTSVVVPLLVHARTRDADGGEAFTQRLLSFTVVGLTILCGLLMFAAPVLMWLCGIQSTLGTSLARILLAELVLYGIGGMLGAILISREAFAAPAWAPVVNNLIVIATGAMFIYGQAGAALDPASITPAQVWLLGAGTAAGIAGQVAFLVPVLRRTGWRWKWRFDTTGMSGLGDTGRWVLVDSVATQAGFLLIVALANMAGSVSGIGSSVYANASVLLEMPYAIVGAALLTALLPRMSRAAAQGDRLALLRDLATGTRLSVLVLGPAALVLMAFGPSISVLVFGRGEVTGQQAHAVGVVVAACAFSLVPIAVTGLHRQLFYAMKDARTPALINVFMLAVRIPLCVGCAFVLPETQVVTGLGVAIGLSYLAGSFFGARRVKKWTKRTTMAYSDHASDEGSLVAPGTGAGRLPERSQ